jgi:hypothetical protein
MWGLVLVHFIPLIRGIIYLGATFLSLFLSFFVCCCFERDRTFGALDIPGACIQLIVCCVKFEEVEAFFMGFGFFGFFWFF